MIRTAHPKVNTQLGLLGSFLGYAPSCFDTQIQCEEPQALAAYGVGWQPDWTAEDWAAYNEGDEESMQEEGR